MINSRKLSDERFVLATRACANLAAAAKLKPMTDLTLLPLNLREGYRSSSGDLIVQPAIDLQPNQFAGAVGETRLDVLLIETGLPLGLDPVFYFTALLPRSGRLRQLRSMRLWLGGVDELHVVHDPKEHPQMTSSFSVGQWLREVQLPWTDETDRQAGLERADALLIAD